jgi:hypothetical protein
MDRRAKYMGRRGGHAGSEHVEAMLAERIGGSGSRRGHGLPENEGCGAKSQLAKSRNTLRH